MRNGCCFVLLHWRVGRLLEGTSLRRVEIVKERRITGFTASVSLSVVVLDVGWFQRRPGFVRCMHTRPWKSLVSCPLGLENRRLRESAVCVAAFAAGEWRVGAWPPLCTNEVISCPDIARECRCVVAYWCCLRGSFSVDSESLDFRPHSLSDGSTTESTRRRWMSVVFWILDLFCNQPLLSRKVACQRPFELFVVQAADSPGMFLPCFVWPFEIRWWEIAGGAIGGV